MYALPQQGWAGNTAVPFHTGTPAAALVYMELVLTGPQKFLCRPCQPLEHHEWSNLLRHGARGYREQSLG